MKDRYLSNIIRDAFTHNTSTFKHVNQTHQSINLKCMCRKNYVKSVEIDKMKNIGKQYMISCENDLWYLLLSIKTFWINIYFYPLL